MIRQLRCGEALQRRRAIGGAFCLSMTKVFRKCGILCVPFYRRGTCDEIYCEAPVGVEDRISIFLRWITSGVDRQRADGEGAVCGVGELQGMSCCCVQRMEADADGECGSGPEGAS